MAESVNTLMEEAKCYLCLGNISQFQAMVLALLNRAASGGGAWTQSQVLAPALPYVVTAVGNTLVEFNYSLDTHAGGPAALSFKKTGIAANEISLDDGGAIGALAIYTALLTPGETITVTDTSSGGGVASLVSVNIYRQ